MNLIRKSSYLNLCFLGPVIDFNYFNFLTFIKVLCIIIKFKLYFNLGKVFMTPIIGLER